MFEFSNGSGKFYGTYQTWHFHKSSNHPLIRSFADAAEKYAPEFERIYKKKLNIEFISLAYTPDASRPLCIRHKDGFFFDGQLHLTILGNSHIIVEDPNEKVLTFDNGTFWYLNGSEYFHTIQPTHGERFELLAPVNQRPEDVAAKKICISDAPERYLDSTHPGWISLRSRQIEHVRQAVIHKRASNLQIAAFNEDFDKDVEANNKDLKV